MSFVVSLTDYTPPKRYDSQPWTRAQILYSLDNVQPYVILSTIILNPVDGNPAQPITRNFTVTAPTTAGWLLVVFFDAASGQAPTVAIQYPAPQGQGASNPTVISARYAVRHRLRDGIPLMDANPVPFNTVRLEDLTDQIPAVPTPIQTVFQCRYQDIPTQRYMNAQIIPGTLVAFVDNAWTSVTPTVDVDSNGNFTLPVAPVIALKITYAWQYLSDGEIDQFIDEARQWLREFSLVSQVPDGLVPALVSYAASRALMAIQRSATLAPVHAGDSQVDWSKLAEAYGKEVITQYNTACKERKEYYTQGPEALDPTAVDVSAPNIGPYTPMR